MPDFRAHGAPASPDSPVLTLSRDETHHLCVVNRARAGDPVTVFNGRGNEWDCRLRSASKAGAELEITGARKAPPLPFQLALAQALPKGQSMDAIVRKATEIGTRNLYPLETERTQVHLDADRSDRKHDKWSAAALEAAKQCGNPWLPEVSCIQPLDTFLCGEALHHDLRLVASLHPGARRLEGWLEELPVAPRSAVWLIGPEGDLSPAEVSRAVAAGFKPVTLGPLVLRCETAATYALSVLSHEWQSRWP
ncbi:RsmE family RNA methyltransferase [Nibricoccus sp. IMCC34717]|uniref:RsmE family RNA methyltransferase n=1 Tax=Nibricoccus sp. IMCC34717 TaxID=3034021 RepID=UPI00384E2463